MLTSKLPDGSVESLPLDLRYPETVVARYNMIREIFMGCNARRLGISFPCNTYMFDLEHLSNSVMLTEFLHFIHTGKPDPDGKWPVYGPFSEVKGPRSTYWDTFDNNRCRWWLAKGYDWIYK